MRLATIDDGTRDGQLALVSPDGLRVAPVADIAPTLQAALDDWRAHRPALAARAERLRHEAGWGAQLSDTPLKAPLPRAYEWLDGSSYLHHVRLARAARGATLPPQLESEPLMYQGGSGALLSATAPFACAARSLGLDYEAELCVALLDTPESTSPKDALDRVALLLLANDWTYRGLARDELGKGFGFVLSKPATAFAPLAVTPDELGGHWSGGRAQLQVRSWVNGEPIGDVNASVGMQFSFAELIAHACRTRTLVAGTLLGSGTVSNGAPGSGVSCLVERRWQEQKRGQSELTPLLKPGDRVRIEATLEGRNLFGSIDQAVVAREGAWRRAHE